MSMSDRMLFVPVEVTKEFVFEAAHNLLDYKGACEFCHGHSYRLQVTVKGVPEQNGLLIDFKELKATVNEVIDNLDHNYLNGYFEFNSTCENMVKWLWVELEDKFPSGVNLEKLKLWETEKSFATLRSIDVWGN